MGFVKFMSSGTGRLTRIVAGVALIAVGYVMHSTAGTILAVVGIVPLAAGVFDICAFAPLFGASLKGSEIRRSS